MNLENYRNIKLNGFKLTAATAGLDMDWLDKLLARLDHLPPVPYAKNRHRGLVAMPAGSRFPNAFVKTYAHTDCQHRAFRRRHPLRRLFPRYAVKEGRAYLNFQRSGLKVPSLIAFGEEWQWGIRNRGVVVVEAVEAPSLQQLLHDTPDRAWISRIFETMAQIHNTGVTHGDAHLVNFLCRGQHIFSIDIVNSKPLSHKGRITDIKNVLISIFLEIDDPHIVRSGVTHYETRTGHAVEHLDKLLETAVGKARQAKENKDRQQMFRAASPRVLSLE